MKFFIMFLITCCVIFSILAIVNTIQLKKIKQKTKEKIYYTPKLSSLDRKDFETYMGYLIKDLY